MGNKSTDLKTICKPWQSDGGNTSALLRVQSNSGPRLESNASWRERCPVEAAMAILISEFSLTRVGVPSFTYTVDTWYEVSRERRIPGKVFCIICIISPISPFGVEVNTKIGNPSEDIWSSIDTAKFYTSNLSSLSSEKRALCFEYSFSVSCFAVRGMVNGWSWWENRDELLDEEFSSDDPRHNLKAGIICSYLRTVHTWGSYEFVWVHIHYRITRILQSTRQETEGNKRRESN